MIKIFKINMLFGISTILLCGCNGGTSGSANTAPKSAKSSNNNLPMLGQGWNSITQTLAPAECFQAASTPTSVDGSVQKVYSSVGQSIFKNIFDFNFKLSSGMSSSAPMESFSVNQDTAFNFASKNQSETISAFLYVTRAQNVYVNYENKSLPQYILSQVGQDIYNNHPLDFVKECGDSLVTGVEYDASALMRLDVSSQNSEALYDLSNSITAKGSENTGFASASANIATAIKTTIGKYGTSFVINYNSIIDGGGIFPIVPQSGTCSNTDKDGDLDCSQIIDSMNQDADKWTSSFPNWGGNGTNLLPTSSLPSGAQMGMTFNGKIQTEKLSDDGFPMPSGYAANDVIANLYRTVSKKYLHFEAQKTLLANYAQLYNTSNPPVANLIQETLGMMQKTEDNVDKVETQIDQDCGSTNTQITTCEGDLTQLSTTLDGIPRSQLFAIDEQLGSNFAVNVIDSNNKTQTFDFQPVGLDNMYKNISGANSLLITPQANSAVPNPSPTPVDISFLKQDDNLTSAPVLLSSNYNVPGATPSSLYLGLYNDLNTPTFNQYNFTNIINPDLPLLNGKTLSNNISYERMLLSSYDQLDPYNKYPANVQLAQDLFMDKEYYMIATADSQSQTSKAPAYAYVLVLEDDGNLAEYAFKSSPYDPSQAVLLWKTSYDNTDPSNKDDILVDELFFDHHTGTLWIGEAGSTPTSGYRHIIFQPTVDSNSPSNMNYTIRFQSDGNLAIFDYGNHPIWFNSVIHPDISGKATSQINVSNQTNLLYSSTK